jgi:hypothetical protein
MSGEMKVYERTDFLALVPGSDVAEAMEMNRDGDEGFSERDLVSVKSPSGGGLFWTVKGANGVESVPSLEGVIVFRCLRGNLWKSDDTSTDRPVLTSLDMKVARLEIPWEEVPADMQAVLPNHELTVEEIRKDARFANVTDENLPRLFWWDGPNKLPYCEFGSSTKPGSKGKRAKDYQILYLLRKNEGLPIRIQLGPTAIQTVRQFFNQMTDVPFVRAVIKISLKEEVNVTGQKYSLPVLERTGILPADVGADINEKYRHPIKAAHEAGRLNFVDTEE